MTTLGWRAGRVEGWELGRIWRYADGSYLVLEQSEDVRGERAERRAPGMNHLALRVRDRELLDRVRREAPGHGWQELSAEHYPHAGGEGHTAWYAEDPHGIEVELVAGP
ncbi:VOC family protein [Brachybacterium conglomeratum]|uniref:VOC family protein n=1 Tax=Brachybacterium conglomeratum TaxID=47846 RepID=UPI003D9FB56A